VVRQKADGTETIVYDEMKKAVNHSDSIQLTLPIDPLKDRGQNKIIVTLDPELKLEEISESNNTFTKSFVIADDDVRPAYPAEFAIVNTPSVKLKASTSKFLSAPAEFLLELDTTALFDSPFKLSQTQMSAGGVIEFSPSLQMRDSTVYYWRVAKKPDTGTVKNWANSSYVYLPNSGPGWSQSHYYQFLKNDYDGLTLQNCCEFEYAKANNEISIRSGVFPNLTNQVRRNLNFITSVSPSETFGSLDFILVDKNTSNAIDNQRYSPVLAKYNSAACARCLTVSPRQFFFSYNNATSRKFAYDAFDSIPNNTILIIQNWNSIQNSGASRFINEWKNDTLTYGAGKSLYHKFIDLGATVIDSFYYNRPLMVILEKSETGIWKVLEQKIGVSTLDILTSSFTLNAYLNSGTMKTQLIGPSKKWSRLILNTFPNEVRDSDSVKHEIYGIDSSKNRFLLFSSSSKQIDTSLLFVDAAKYQYLSINQFSTDNVFNTPPQTKKIHVEYSPYPEGAIVPAAITSFKDTVETGEKINISTAFRNISDVAFDSIKVIMSVTDETNQTKLVLDTRKRPILAGDSIVVDYLLDTKDIKGVSSVVVNFNPDFAQPEQYLFNNYQTIPLSVTPDKTPPNLDVTFDGVRILNKDIVSAKPFIVMTLKDDSRFLALNDTSLFTVKLRSPDGNIKNVRFDGDTLKFIPATLDAVGKENAATVHYRPNLIQDGEYELIVFAKDRSNNPSGSIDYSVAFEVVNKSMISNLLNYPNPFTTSTAFVFTLTGSELPSQFRIQILTITGKIVKEINKEELGPIRIGNNITEYKWDGRDQFGQTLANGVYLYRVVADMNGKKIEKLNTGAYNTDKYFKSGYGKMYLMR
jgi:hypothetical protein